MAFDRGKYIVGVFATTVDLDFIAFCFPDNVIHFDVARAMDLNVVSAGFFQVVIEQGRPTVQVFGKSESIGASSQPEDARLIAKSLGIYGLATQAPAPSPRELTFDEEVLALHARIGWRETVEWVRKQKNLPLKQARSFVQSLKDRGIAT